MGAVNSGIDNSGRIAKDEPAEDSGEDERSANNQQAKKRLPDFVPGGSDFFGVAAGTHKAIAGDDNIDKTEKTGDDNDELKKVVKESK